MAETAIHLFLILAFLGVAVTTYLYERNPRMRAFWYTFDAALLGYFIYALVT